jgi:hypothetical protein
MIGFCRLSLVSCFAFLVGMAYRFVSRHGPLALAITALGEVAPGQGTELRQAKADQVEQPQHRGIARVSFEPQQALHLGLGHDALGQPVLDRWQRHRAAHVRTARSPARAPW